MCSKLISLLECRFTVESHALIVSDVVRHDFIAVHVGPQVYEDRRGDFLPKRCRSRFR